MKRFLIAMLVVALPSGVAVAKKKKSPPVSSSAQKSKDGSSKPPPPNDKRTNEGAQGRMNATEDAAQSADSPQWQNRP